jgi:DNA-binding MarR family transcriptional regulator
MTNGPRFAHDFPSIVRLSYGAMKRDTSRNHPVDDNQALALDEGVATLLRRFKLEPSMIAGSPYADLHATDVGLLIVLREPGEWNVRKIAQAIAAPISTISSALDRLENRGLLARKRESEDRRVVQIELTTAGNRLVGKIRSSQIEICRVMLSKLDAQEREQLIRLVARIAQA